jgi:hypothetical protein
MSYSSPVRIDWSPEGENAVVTLTPRGGWLAGPLRMSGEQQLFEADGVLAPNGYFLPIGGATVTVTFETEEDMASHAEALEVFSQAELLGGTDLLGSSGQLFLHGERTTMVMDAVITRIDPGLPFGPESSVTRAYTIVGMVILFSGIPVT